MNVYYALGGATIFLIGLVHSWLGERLIFQRLRRSDPARPLVPTRGGEFLQERHVRILWANWHLTTALGWGVAGALLVLARAPASESARWLGLSLAAGLAASAALVLVGTRGRHPGWIGLLVAATLTLLGARGP